MDEYRFVGVNTNIGNENLKALGQRIMLSREAAADAIEGGAQLVPADRFDAIGFTADELRDYKHHGGRMNAPEAFWDKMRAAWQAVGVAGDGAEV